MTGKQEDLKADAPEGDDAPAAPESVAAFLRANPDFLLDRPDLLGALTPPEWRDGDSVVDFQRFMVDRLHRRLRQQGARERSLMAAAEANAVTLTRVHGAALALLDAGSLGAFVLCINRDLPGLLGLDLVTLCIEASAPLAESGADGIVLLTPGSVGRLLPDDTDFVLRRSLPEDSLVLATAGGRIGSVALLRIGLGKSMPDALLALGAADADEFHDGQATDLLAFLAGVIERCLARWADSLP